MMDVYSTRGGGVLLQTRNLSNQLIALDYLNSNFRKAKKANKDRHYYQAIDAGAKEDVCESLDRLVGKTIRFAS